MRRAETKKGGFKGEDTRAILFCRGFREELAPLLKTRPSSLLNVADKPILFHILEHLAQRGIRIFDLVLHHFPEQIEEKIEEGTRWGIKVNYHLAKYPERPLHAVLPAVKRWKNTSVLIGFCDSLPLIPEHPFDSAIPQFYRIPDEEWSGWAFISSNDLKRISGDTPYLLIPSKFKPFSAIEVMPYIDTRDFACLKKTNQKFLNRRGSSLLYPTTLKNIEPGIWISRAVIMEPGVKIFPPVMIGEDTQIKSGARIGPNVIIENQCIIDNGSNISDSLICQRSYIGEKLEIENCIVDRNSLINLSHGAHLEIEEEFLISEVNPPSPVTALRKILERGLGLFLFILLVPFYFIMRIFFSIKKEEMALHSQSLEREANPTFGLYAFDLPIDVKKKPFVKFFERLPSLLNLIRGEISFVGTKIRTVEELQHLPLEWRELVLSLKSGLITLADSEEGNIFSKDEQYAQDVYYAARQSFPFDLKIALRWFFKKPKGYT